MPTPQPSPPSWIESLASYLLRPWFAGIGCLVGLHRVIPEAQRSKLPQNRALEITPADLRAVLEWVRRNGFDVIRLDELRSRLAEPRGPKFVCFTFEDGYRDTVTHALPVFREFGFPFALYLTTGFIGRTTSVWWYFLEKLLTQRSDLTLDWEGRSHTWHWSTTAERDEVFTTFAAWLDAADPNARQRLLDALARASAIDPLGETDALMLTWDDVTALASDWHVTLGAHGKSHLGSATLDDEHLKIEYLDPKLELEARIGRSLHHFAYPAGTKGALTPRDIDLARDADYYTAVTSLPGNLFAKHAWHLLSLPRLMLNGNASALPHFRRLENGCLPAAQNHWKRFVTP
jgi:peptidoglycan/xylan/chitin deacetylase (PgdA/CDA1 family)